MPILDVCFNQMRELKIKTGVEEKLLIYLSLK